NLRWIGKGLSDFLAEQFSVASAQPMHRDAHCALSHAKRGGGLRVRDGALAQRQEGLQFIKEFSVIDRRVFLAELLDNSLEQRHRPRAVEKLVRTQIVPRLDLIARVRVLPVEGKSNGTAAAFLAIGSVPFVREKML